MAAPRLVILVGPTAVGKTALAVHLARRLGAEIINADSVQVYRGLDIGSAKPTAEELALARHHLVDVAGPEEEMSAARFAGLAQAAIAEVSARGRRALVAGGTGLYVRAVLYGLVPAPPVDQELRESLARDWREQGGQALHARLAGLDPAAAARLHPADRQRVLRALEVCLQTGQPFSARQQGHGFQTPRYPHLALGLQRPRPELNARIEQRCRQMWEQGLLKEVESLLAAGVSPQARCLGSLGYAQALAVLAGQMDQPQALAETIRLTKAYAKRQMTWFRGMTGIRWYNPAQADELEKAARDFWQA